MSRIKVGDRVLHASIYGLGLLIRHILRSSARRCSCGAKFRGLTNGRRVRQWEEHLAAEAKDGAT